MVSLVGALPAAAQDSSAPTVDFQRQVRPILADNCFQCHGPDESTRQVRLRLDTEEGAFAERPNGHPVVAGDPDASLVLQRITHADTRLRMPPAQTNKTLSDEQIEVLRRWIDEGAAWDQHWAFKPIERPEAPAVAAADWARAPLDRFVLARLEAEGLAPAPEADRRTLARRAALDLTGLPPDPALLEAFLNDPSDDAYETFVDRLLATEQWGEHRARYWLDAARYGDTHGIHIDNYREMYPYRDWVIRAFNRNKPFDEFTLEQVAGDLLSEPSLDQLVASGFQRNNITTNEGGVVPEEYEAIYAKDRAETVGNVFLGLTVGCATCHDHKFDPILQKDYYSMQASIFGYVEIDYPLLDRDEADAYFAAMRDVDDRQQPLHDEVDAIETPYREELRAQMIRERFPENVQAAAFKPEAERTPGEQLLATQVLTINPPRAQVAAALTPEDNARVDELNAEIAALEDQRPPTPAMAHIVTDGDYRFAPDGPGDQVIGCPECRTPPDVDGTYLYEEGGPAYQAPPNYFLIRGDPFSPGSPMSPGFLTAATYGDPPTEIPRPDGRTSGRRLALAEWIASRDNPLTARVMVNRIWHHHFGRGIVRTLDNLGRMGDTPTHPELLDWLAVEFMDRGWSFKELHRLLMTSEAYRMASSFRHEASADADPENNLLWHYRGQRLEAEILRDAIMTVSGGIDLTVGGPAVFPHIPADILFQSDGKGFWCGSPPAGRRITAPSTGLWCEEPDRPEVWRRSVYVFRRRSLGFPFFDTFDLPDQNQTAAARNVSTVSTQALTLMNNPFVLNQAELFAARLEREAPGDLDAQIDLAYLIALTRKPSDMEREIARGLATEQSLVDFTHVMLNLNEFLYLR
jgi:mono/diheme cytochrome c family protein